MIAIIVTLFALAGYFNYWMDAIQFRGLFKDSWRNKWKNGNPEEGERFLLSSTVLVFLTDPWHRAKWAMYICYELAFSIVFLSNFSLSFWWTPLVVVSIKAIRGGTFSIFFR